MNWKDWLYIPKSDKIAILVLLSVILILLGVKLFFIHRPKQLTKDMNEYIPADYKEWLQQLIEQQTADLKEIDNNTIDYTPYRLPKMRNGQTVEINTADSDQLKMIPGIGHTFANRIIKYREALGGYASLEQLNEVWGLDTHLYASITPYLTIDPQYDSLYINLDSFEKLKKHPYLSYKQVLAITDIRERKGNFKSLNRLMLLEEFKQRDIDKLKPYINFKEK